MQQADILNIITDCVRLRIAESDDSDEINKITTFVVEVKTGLLPTQFNVKEHLVDFWENEIRPSNLLTSFVLKLITEVRFKSGLSDSEWTTLVENLASSTIVVTNQSASAIDKVLSDRVPSGMEVKSLLSANPWAVIILLLTLAPLPELKKPRPPRQPQ